jgi:hypothetical protein
MTLARRSGLALAIAGSVLTLAAAAPRVFTPGYTYRLRINSQITEPNGKTKDVVVMSGRAMVTSKAGRLDIEEAAKERGAMGEKGGYILYDSTSMMIVSPNDKQIVKFSFDDMEKGMSALAANVPGMRITISDVAVNFEKLGAGEPLLGMATSRYRVTQDYRIAMKVAFMNRNSTEHLVQEYWMADQKSGFANPFARMGGGMRMGGSGAFAELMTKTAEATSRMGRGIPLKTLTTSTSTNDKGEKTQTVSTMEVTELKSGNVDDAMLVAPADYKVMDMGEQTKAMAAQFEQAKAANAQAAQAGQATEVKPDSGPSAKAAAKDAAAEAAKEAAKQGLRKGFGGLLRRP